MTGFTALPNSLPGFPRSSRYLIGVSGGRDSVALLHWLVRQGYERLIVCHLDHQLRGQAAQADARSVRRLAEKWKLSCEIGQVAVGAAATAKKQSIETAGRAARLGFFQEVARRRRCRTIFLGHHADDQVETFLLQLFRGAGGRGLGGMREISEVGALRIVRPFLGIWRSEIDQYVAEQRLKFREDATNAELTARRNRLRHAIIPDLEKKLGRPVRENLWRAAQVLAEEDAFLESLLPNDFSVADSFSTKGLSELPLALQRRSILRWLRAHEIRNVGYAEIEKVRQLAAAEARVAKINLSGDRHARRRAGKIFLE